MTLDEALEFSKDKLDRLKKNEVGLCPIDHR